MNYIKTNLQVSFYKEGNQFVAYCPAFDLSTCGDSFEEARRNFTEALDILISETIKMGTLEEVLLNCGWKKTKRPRLKWKPPVSQFITEKTEHVKLPCPT